MSEMHYNKQMSGKLIDLRKTSVNLSDYTIRAVDKLINTRFVEWDGCVLLDSHTNPNNPLERFIPNDLVVDRTAFEAFSNHIFISDINQETESEPMKALAAAIEISTAWGYRLKQIFPNDNFRIVISQDEISTSVRLYKYRADEVSWLLEEDLDGYKYEALAVMRI